MLTKSEAGRSPLLALSNHGCLIITSCRFLLRGVHAWNTLWCRAGCLRFKTVAIIRRPGDFETLPAYLVEMTNLLDTISPKGAFEEPGDEFVLLQRGTLPFRVTENVHPSFMPQAVLRLSRSRQLRSSIDDTSSCWFFTRTPFLAAISWLDVRKGSGGMVPN